MRLKTMVVMGLSGCLWMTGCQTTEPVEEERAAVPYGSTGMALSVDFKGKTDVVGMRFEVETCQGKPVLSKSKALEDLQLPGMIPTFVDNPFDGQSSHLFADHFMVLPAGCYNVRVTPITNKGAASEDCASASAQNVTVHDGLTTEIVLISQCKGAQRGALDVIAALNHPPVLKQLKYHPSKFLQCPAEVILCATASDPDDDPIEFEWKQVYGPAPMYGPVVTTRSEYGGKITECVKIAFEDLSANYGFKVNVYDMFHDSQAGLVRAEKWFELNGYGEVDSRASLKFPVYVSCDDDDHKKPDAGEPDVHEPDVHEPDVHEPDVEVPGDACPLTQGFWKTHHRYATNPSQQLNWPLSEDTMLCGQRWLDILHTEPAGGDAWYVLAHQYIAARLNVANGAPTSSQLLEALAEAQSLLAACMPLTPPPTPERDRAIELAELLTRYNEGTLLACGNNRRR
jgi:hypothetical protein